MRFIAILDMILITISGIFDGMGLYYGWIFCSHPGLIYFLATIAINIWYMFSLSSVFLAFNRCVEMFSSDLGRKLFQGRRIYCWQIMPIIYASYFFWFEKPVILSSLLGGWFFNPFEGVFDDYVNVGFFGKGSRKIEG